ncbi:protein phosphatase CheZ [Microvirga puerhi]|uniref:Protein phosphatase CheZ n=1 Tax=Microvirga puerhi TaxID=2876078 RepID=A0ABS7VUW0_9HYPH|nr:protein phosphatase CheZ [Microvirga puerhi]MBZ6079356.1 protein phosphatase CheZ [Microvirga puerhi]
MSTSKVHSIEVAASDALTNVPEFQRHTEIMEAIAPLRKHVKVGQDADQMSEERRHDLLEMQRLKAELHAISDAIQRTKQEIATLHYTGAQGREMARVTDELGAVVIGTEGATHSILEAAESIDEIASMLASSLSGHESSMAHRINEKIVSIFEACNFQDITGQRISKVVSAMRFVEERVEHMIQIWGGFESFKDVPKPRSADREGDKRLLNGPPLDTESSTSQADIDAFFK